MKKFIVIDYKLVDLNKHHYEYSLSVAEAAQKLGYESIILSNHAFLESLYFKDIKVISVFKNHSFKILKFPIINDHKNIINSIFISRFRKLSIKIKKLILTSLFDSYSLQPNSLNIFLEKVEGSTTRLNSWFKQDLERLENFPFFHTLGGLLKIILGINKFIYNSLSIKIKEWTESVKYFIKRMLPSESVIFTKILATTLKNIGADCQDHIFIHSLEIEKLKELCKFIQSSDPAQTPHYHVIQHIDINTSLVSDPRSIVFEAILNNIYQAQLWPQKITFYTDTKELTSQYNRLSPIRFVTAPIPCRHIKLEDENIFNPKKEAIHIVYFGNSRQEDGYQYLPKLVDSLWSSYIQTGRVRFTIQSDFTRSNSDLALLEARLLLEEYPSSKVCLLKHLLDPDEYDKLLLDADLIIIPYEVESYQNISVRVLVEALAVGKPVVVPANTWMANQIDSFRGKIYEDPQIIDQTILEIVNNFDQFAEAAYQSRIQWQTKHSPDALIQFLIQEKSFVAANITTESKHNNAPKILFIREGDQLLKRNKSSTITLNHFDYFSKCGYQVSVIFFSKIHGEKHKKFKFFIDQIQQLIQGIPFNDVWFIPKAPRNIFFSKNQIKEYKKYYKLGQKFHSGLVSDLLTSSLLNLSSELISNIKDQNFDLIFIDSVTHWFLLEKLQLQEIPVICEVPKLYYLHYASLNQRDINEEELKLECELLQKCSTLLFHNTKNAEKISEIISSNRIYSLPEEEFLHPSHDYTNLLKNIISSTLDRRDIQLIPRPSLKPSKVAILYPWGDILERKSGASQRVGLLTDYLKENQYSLWIFSLGTQADKFRDHVFYSFYQALKLFSKTPLVESIYYDAYQSLIRSLNLIQPELTQSIDLEAKWKDTESWLPWIYYQFRFDHKFLHYIENIIDWADVVILEYPFWASIVGPICHAQKVKLIITAHDVIAKQLDQKSLIGKIALAEEIHGLKQADYIVSVSEEDQKFFMHYGLENQVVIPNPVNFKYINSMEVKSSCKGALIINQVQIPRKAKDYLGLFVGSKYKPNVEAAELIRTLAKDETGKLQQVKISLDFVVVGDCCNPQKDVNFLSLGKIEAIQLSRLYQLANFVISPLLTGTGTSLKIIEAMAYGKVVLGTSISFRGYPVTNEIHCLICDEIDLYPQIIIDLLSNPERTKKISLNAIKFAEFYDYRYLYDSYDKIIRYSSFQE